jgi:hypothetical protein
MNASVDERASLYEAPRALRLGSRSTALGACEPTGSGDYYCHAGNAATDDCDGNGSDASDFCTTTGSGAGTDCNVAGLDAATCIPAGSAAG